MARSVKRNRPWSMPGEMLMGTLIDRIFNGRARGTPHDHSAHHGKCRDIMEGLYHDLSMVYTMK